MGKMIMRIKNSNDRYIVDYEDSIKPKFFDIVKNDDKNPFHSFFLTEENPVLISSETVKSKRFENETDLKAGILSSYLKTIESNAFKNCTELKEIYFAEIASNKQTTVAETISVTEMLPNKNEKEIYKTNTDLSKSSLKILLNGNLFASLPKDDSNSLILCANSFFNCTKLHTVLLPPCGNLIIEKSAFENCSALRTVLILCNHAKIHENAFAGCENVVLVSNCEEVLSFARNNNLEQIDVR